jgi:hypothetical protein
MRILIKGKIKNNWKSRYEEMNEASLIIKSEGEIKKSIRRNQENTKESSKVTRLYENKT